MIAKTIPLFPNYSVTKTGDVLSLSRCGTSGGMLKKQTSKAGYFYVNLYRGGKLYHKSVHRLVLETWLGLCPPGMETCHNNNMKKDNRLSNLHWGTKSSNIKDAVRDGLHPSSKQNGEANPIAVLKAEQVRVIFHSYHDGAYTQQELAGAFGVSATQISRIVSVKRWGHLRIGG